MSDIQGLLAKDYFGLYRTFYSFQSLREARMPPLFPHTCHILPPFSLRHETPPAGMFSRLQLVCMFVHKNVHTPSLMACFWACFCTFFGGFSWQTALDLPGRPGSLQPGLRKTYSLLPARAGGWFPSWQGACM